MMAFVMATMGWAIYTDPQDAPPLPLLVVMFGIPAGCIVGTLKVLLSLSISATVICNVCNCPVI